MRVRNTLAAHRVRSRYVIGKLARSTAYDMHNQVAAFVRNPNPPDPLASEALASGESAGV